MQPDVYWGKVEVIYQFKKCNVSMSTLGYVAQPARRDGAVIKINVVRKQRKAEARRWK